MIKVYDGQTYEKNAIAALVETLKVLFERRPGLQVLISGAVRNLDTFETFRDACCKFSRRHPGRKVCANCLVVSNKFQLEEIDFQPKPMREQTSLFYATAVPLKILSINAPQ